MSALLVLIIGGLLTANSNWLASMDWWLRGFGWGESSTQKFSRSLPSPFPHSTSFLMLLDISHKGNCEYFGTLGPTFRRFGGGKHKHYDLGNQNRLVFKWLSVVKSLVCNIKLETQHPQLNMLIFLRPPHCCDNATALFALLKLLNITEDIQRLVTVVGFYHWRKIKKDYIKPLPPIEK